MSDTQRQKIKDVMATLKLIGEDKAFFVPATAMACREVLQEVLDLEAKG